MANVVSFVGDKEQPARESVAVICRRLVLEKVMHIDTTFDFNSERLPGQDADTWSPTLQAYHQFLWSKPLPSGVPFTLETAGRPGTYHLIQRSDGGERKLSSDAITTRLRKSPIAKTLTDEERPPHLGYTIGSAIIFPRRQREGKQNINQGRGTHPLIKDRFDLTLECIRRHYAGSASPLSDLLERYADFFELFGDFRGYVSFFLLDDLVDSVGAVRFFHPFADFTTPAVPKTRDDYLSYLAASNEFIAARNKRIAAWATAPN